MREYRLWLRVYIAPKLHASAEEAPQRLLSLEKESKKLRVSGVCLEEDRRVLLYYNIL